MTFWRRYALRWTEADKDHEEWFFTKNAAREAMLKLGEEMYPMEDIRVSQGIDVCYRYYYSPYLCQGIAVTPDWFEPYMKTGQARYFGLSRFSAMLLYTKEAEMETEKKVFYRKKKEKQYIIEEELG